jgi:hypothetical protein
MKRASVSSTDQGGGKRRRGASLRVRQQARSGCVFESRIIQECADSTIDPLLLSLADYASFVEAVSLYGHQSGRRPVIDRKDCFHVQCALHGCITTSCTPSFLGARVMSLQARGQSPPMALAPLAAARQLGDLEAIQRASSR